MKDFTLQLANQKLMIVQSTTQSTYQNLKPVEMAATVKNKVNSGNNSASHHEKVSWWGWDLKQALLI